MLGEIGLSIIEVTVTNLEGTLKKLEEIKKPKAALEFVVIDGMKRLFERAYKPRAN